MIYYIKKLDKNILDRDTRDIIWISILNIL